MIYGRILPRRPFWFDGPDQAQCTMKHPNPNANANTNTNTNMTSRKTHYTLADTHSLDASSYLDIWQIHRRARAL